MARWDMIIGRHRMTRRKCFGKLSRCRLEGELAQNHDIFDLSQGQGSMHGADTQKHAREGVKGNGDNAGQRQVLQQHNTLATR